MKKILICTAILSCLLCGCTKAESDVQKEEPSVTTSVSEDKAADDKPAEATEEDMIIKMCDQFRNEVREIQGKYYNSKNVIPESDHEKVKNEITDLINKYIDNGDFKEYSDIGSSASITVKDDSLMMCYYYVDENTVD